MGAKRKCGREVRSLDGAVGADKALGPQRQAGGGFWASRFGVRKADHRGAKDIAWMYGDGAAKTSQPASDWPLPTPSMTGDRQMPQMFDDDGTEMIPCEMCYGHGEWETECCNGDYGCSCGGRPVPMGQCQVCRGLGWRRPDADTHANIRTIQGLCYIGTSSHRRIGG